MNSTKRVQLPKLTKDNLTVVYSQLRPYREGGIRIEKQTVQGKQIYHNYGHGGSGISLSYGTVLRAVKLFENSHSKSKECAVVGAGIMGLLTAVILAEKGYKVKIYSKDIPEFGVKDNSKMITSQIAPGFWFPYDYLSDKKLQTREIAKQSLQVFRENLKTNRYKSIKDCQVIDRAYQQDAYTNLEGALLKNDLHKEIVDLGNGEHQQFRIFTTVRIDMQIWIKQIIDQLKKLNVEFQKVAFKSKADILNLKQSTIFNCSGYASKYLFGDSKMYAIRGHILQFKNNNPSKYNYVLGAKTTTDKILGVYCQEARILLGMSRQQTDKIQYLLTEYNIYYNQQSQPRAKL